MTTEDQTAGAPEGVPPWLAFLHGNGRAAALVGFLLFTLIAFSVAMVPIRADNDCWWHVKTGQVIARDGLPTYDVFSFTAADHVWHNHEWLTQLAMWKIWEAGERTPLGGWRAIILAVGICIWLAYGMAYLLAGKLGRNWWLALLISIIALDLSRRTFYPRPPVVSNVLLIGQLFLLVGIYERWWSRRWLLVIPPLYVLWSNLHGAWMAGAVILCAFAGQDLLRHGLERIGRLPAFLAGERVPSKWWLILAPITVLATFANPSGWGLYALPARVMGEPLLVSLIGELLPPNWRFYPLAVVFLAVLAITALLLLIRMVLYYVAQRSLPEGTGLPLAELMVLAFFLWQGANHVRHLMLFGLLMAPVVARLFVATHRHVFGGRRGFGYAGLPLCALAALLLLSSWPEAQSYPSRNRQLMEIRNGYIAHNFPAAPADFIEFADLRGRMFNRNSYAGYLIWRFSPDDHLVFSDSRFDIFGAAILTEELIVTNAFVPDEGESLPSWREVLDKWDVQWMIVQAEDDIARLFAARDEGWALAADWSAFAPYAPAWQIWIRDTEANTEMIERARRRFEGANWSPFRPRQ